MSAPDDPSVAVPDGPPGPAAASPDSASATAVADTAGEAPDLGYVVSLDQFSGPMDLLLYLVKRTELDIVDIPLAEITDQFVATVQQWQDLDLDVAGDFIVMAATLLELKARQLAPPPETGEQPEVEEDEEQFDPRADLIQRLLAYRRFKDAAQELDALERERALMAGRQLREHIPEDPGEADDVPLDALDVHDLFRHFELIMARINGLGPRRVLMDEVPLNVRVQKLLDTVRAEGRSTLQRFLAEERSRLACTGVLVAALECVRQRFLEARQLEQYGEVALRWRDDAERTAVPEPPPEEPEATGRRRKKIPLVTWVAPPPAEGDEEAVAAAEAEEARQETDEQRFLRELDESCNLTQVLALSSDIEASFTAHWHVLHPPPPPAQLPPPVEVAVVAPVPAPTPAPAPPKRRKRAESTEAPATEGAPTGADGVAAAPAVPTEGAAAAPVEGFAAAIAAESASAAATAAAEGAALPLAEATTATAPETAVTPEAAAASDAAAAVPAAVACASTEATRGEEPADATVAMTAAPSTGIAAPAPAAAEADGTVEAARESATAAAPIAEPVAVATDSVGATADAGTADAAAQAVAAEQAEGIAATPATATIPSPVDTVGDAAAAPEAEIVAAAAPVDAVAPVAEAPTTGVASAPAGTADAVPAAGVVDVEVAAAMPAAIAADTAAADAAMPAVVDAVVAAAPATAAPPSAATDDPADRPVVAAMTSADPDAAAEAAPAPVPPSSADDGLSAAGARLLDAAEAFAGTDDEELTGDDPEDVNAALLGEDRPRRREWQDPDADADPADERAAESDDPEDVNAALLAGDRRAFDADDAAATDATRERAADDAAPADAIAGTMAARAAADAAAADDAEPTDVERAAALAFAGADDEDPSATPADAVAPPTGLSMAAVAALHAVPADAPPAADVDAAAVAADGAVDGDDGLPVPAPAAASSAPTDPDLAAAAALSADGSDEVDDDAVPVAPPTGLTMAEVAALHRVPADAPLAADVDADAAADEGAATGDPAAPAATSAATSAAPPADPALAARAHGDGATADADDDEFPAAAPPTTLAAHELAALWRRPEDAPLAPDVDADAAADEGAAPGDAGDAAEAASAARTATPPRGAETLFRIVAGAGRAAADEDVAESADPAAAAAEHLADLLFEPAPAAQAPTENETVVRIGALSAAAAAAEIDEDDVPADVGADLATADAALADGCVDDPAAAVAGPEEDADALAELAAADGVAPAARAEEAGSLAAAAVATAPDPAETAVRLGAIARLAPVVHDPATVVAEVLDAGAPVAEALPHAHADPAPDDGYATVATVAHAPSDAASADDGATVATVALPVDAPDGDTCATAITAAAPPGPPDPAPPDPDAPDPAAAPATSTPTDPTADPDMITLHRKHLWLIAAILIAAFLLAWLVVGWVLWRPATVLEVSAPAQVEPQAAWQWRFNLDVVDDAAVGTAPEQAPVIEPAIDGTWAWSDRRTLAFTPTAEPPPAATYKVALAAQALRTVDGFRLADDVVSAVRTPPLRATRVRQVAFAADGTYTVDVAFDRAVDPRRLDGRVVVEAPEAGGPLPVTATTTTRADSVRFAVGPAPAANGRDARVRFTPAPGGQPATAASPLRLDPSWSASVGLGHRLALRAVEAEVPTRGDIVLRLRPNDPTLPLQRAAQAVTVEPAVPFTTRVADGCVLVSGAFAPGATYTVRVAPGYPTGSGDDDLAAHPAAAVLEVAIGDRASGAWLVRDGGALAVHAVNCAAATLTVRAADGTAVVGVPLDLAGERNATTTRALDPDALLAGLPAGDYRLTLDAAGGELAACTAQVRDEPVSAGRLAGALGSWAGRVGQGDVGARPVLRRAHLGN